MKRFFTGMLVVASFVVAIQSCKHTIDDPKPSGNQNPTDTTTNPSNSDTCSLDTVYFVNDILPIIQSNCAQSGCHDAASRQDGVQLTDYDKIISTGKVKAGNANDSKLFEAIMDTDPGDVMPPPPASLTPEQKNAIRIWINQGAKNNKCSNKCDTSNVTFSVNVWPIIESTCKGCHTGSFPSGGVSLNNYNDVKSIADNGVLRSVLERNGPRKPMPPSGALEDCALSQIKIWIKDGAPNN